MTGVSSELDEWDLYKAWVRGAGVSGFPHSRGEWGLQSKGERSRGEWVSTQHG
jgi:hypothetical protein